MKSSGCWLALTFCIAVEMVHSQDDRPPLKSRFAEMHQFFGGVELSEQNGDNWVLGYRFPLNTKMNLEGSYGFERSVFNKMNKNIFLVSAHYDIKRTKRQNFDIFSGVSFYYRKQGVDNYLNIQMGMKYQVVLFAGMGLGVDYKTGLNVSRKHIDNSKHPFPLIPTGNIPSSVRITTFYSW